MYLPNTQVSDPSNVLQPGVFPPTEPQILDTPVPSDPFVTSQSAAVQLSPISDQVLEDPLNHLPNKPLPVSQLPQASSSTSAQTPVSALDQFDTQLQSLVQPQTGSLAKEQLESGGPASTETAPVVELREPEKVPEEVEGWLEKLERGEDIHLPQPITHQDQTLVTPATHTITYDTIVLPLTEEEIELGLHKKVQDSARWLAVWVTRLMRKFPELVRFRPVG